MIDAKALRSEYDPADWRLIASSLEILVDTGFLTRLARLNKNHLVDSRTDSEDELVILKEVLEVRQTNRVLLTLEESARGIIEELNDED